MAGSARDAALTALGKWRKNGAWSDAALDAAVTRLGLDARDAALAARLCYGTLQNLSLLDFYLEKASSVPLGKLEPRVLDILRLAVYQLICMDKIPPSAAVNEAVEQCRRGGFGRASGYVNAVLRRLSREKTGAGLPEIPAPGTAEHLATRYSHPLWLVQEWLEAHGEAFTEAALQADNAETPVCIQTNTCRTDVQTLCDTLTAEGYSVRPHPTLPDALLAGGGRLPASAPFRDGHFFVQDAAANLAVRAAAPAPGMRVLDLCAAPGGKSFAAAVLMHGTGEILSFDLHENKLRRIRESAARLGFTILKTAPMDARQPLPELRASADIVLADVPCSGLGVIRKKPEIRFRDPGALAGLPAIQGAILDGAAACVRPGGVLLYSTCTVRRCENEDVVSAFLARNSAFRPESFAVPGLGAPDGMATLWPHLHGTDGFFICKLRRQA